ncbi:MAG TPA: ATP-binding protein, partial [Candidatus Polarisedimenticolaceae bacterium]|nr:ATP-binding protein [Candidatus Polarisedimenticolaceae bacterium]
LRKKFVGSGEELEGVVAEATESIEREVHALKQLVDEFSLFARLPEIRPRRVDLAPLIDSVVALYTGLPDVDWNVRVGAGLDGVRIDPDQMRRVLINLVDNAVTAMGRRGQIRIAADRLEDGSTVRIEVADTGPGIDPADRDKMFNPYFSTTKRGTGLGLAIVHKVVSDHDGTIRVEPNDPHGARFVIDLPGIEPVPERRVGGAGGA